MEITAKANKIRISPRKSRLVIGLVRGLKVQPAIEQLRFCTKKAARPVSKLVVSALASAINNYNLDKDNLIIKEIRVDAGPVIKRWMPRAHGRATPIRKRMSNISVVLREIKDSGKVESVKQKIEAPIKLGEAPKGVPIDKKVKSKEIEDQDDTQKEGLVKQPGDPRLSGSKGHTKIEGGAKTKGFTSKLFQRKSG